MTRVELTEQGRGPKNRTCLGLLTTCTSVVCLCTLWLGGAGAESCRAGPPPPYTGTDWVSNSSPAEVRNQKSHTTCPRGVRSWQADVVRQSSRCRLDSDCFPLSLTSATGDPHLSWLSAAWSVETLATNNASKTNKLRSQSVLPQMVSHGDKGSRPQKTEQPLFRSGIPYILPRHMQCRGRLCFYVVFRYGLLFCTIFTSHFCGLYLVFSLFLLSCVTLQAAVHSRSRQSPGRHGTELAHLHNKSRSSGPCYL